MKHFLMTMALVAGALGAGCSLTGHQQFVDVASPLHSAQVAVIAANDEIVRLRISGPNEPVFLAMVEPQVIGDGLYLFPSYITKPTVSEQVNVPVVELDLPIKWRNRIYWVEGERSPRWYHWFDRRVHRIERRLLALPDGPA